MGDLHELHPARTFPKTSLVSAKMDNGGDLTGDRLQNRLQAFPGQRSSRLNVGPSRGAVTIVPVLVVMSSSLHPAATKAEFEKWCSHSIEVRGFRILRQAAPDHKSHGGVGRGPLCPAEDDSVITVWRGSGVVWSRTELVPDTRISGLRLVSPSDEPKRQRKRRAFRPCRCSRLAFLPNTLRQSICLLVSFE
jgi:hypothetical protein